MKFPTIIFVTFASLVTITAAVPRDSLSLQARHAHLAHRPRSNDSQPSRNTRRCRPHENNANLIATSTSTHSKPTSAATPNQSSSNPGSGGSTGTIKVNSNCGPSGATEKTTSTTGPNGSIYWLNCGIDKGGWHPPYVQMKDLVTQDLSSALAKDSSPFHACSPYVHLFEMYGNQHGIPPIMLASFAMQESSCNPHAVGGGGEQGLMQISRDKCGGAPGGDCQDPDFNIRTASKFFSELVNRNGGDVLLSIGSYNGWYRGLTIGAATAAASSHCCLCQNNLDYIHQFVNGWLQNIDAHNGNIGLYFNLKIC
ncbi:glycoside hydrolase family 23 protein [Amanita thiersii Skay4041]|uniref:Glycoside hydrolase family 23 protein n=1 Tax=Amanita thiersii Skay4041 TaxID=703135 RepID=A0A2A9P0C8_9AGAR|nr:glycoside hydrolase family 23 protein [Amanita thiersii Skay4041]